VDLSAEEQLLSALPRMANASQSDLLRRRSKSTSRRHKLTQRLRESLQLLDAHVRSTACKGMARLIAEGQEVIEKGENQDDVAADLAFVAGAQKVEHYEISSYRTVRTMAARLVRPT